MRRLIALTVLCCSCGIPEDGGNEAHAGPGDDEVSSTGQAVTARLCPGAATVKGIDVSTYQGASIHWASVKSAGYAFGIARVSDGLHYPDSTFAGNWSRMKDAGVIRGAYQYFEPAQDPTAQANLVIARVGRLGPGDLPVMLDVEATGGQSSSVITSRIHTWVNAITAGTGKVPFIYTGAYFWDASVKSHDFASLALNVAWYGTSCPGEPSAWSGHPWTFHQFTDSQSVAGVPGHVDANVFNGTLAQLQAFVGADDGCHHSVDGFTFSCDGPKANRHCVQLGDRALCSSADVGLQFSEAGPVDGMRCTELSEPSDPAWTGGQLCVPPDSPYFFEWSSAGPLAARICLSFAASSSADAWSDDYLCW